MSQLITLQRFNGQPITRQVLLSLLKDYQRPFDKINEWVKQQVLIPVKRGVFVAGPASNTIQPEPFLLANHLLGPSYVSVETALSYWGLIPEQVFGISSATTARSKTYNTAIGRFSYTLLPLPYYSFGQQPVELATNQVALIATPEKALCDKIITTSGILFRSTSQVTAWLIEDMRMDRQLLKTLKKGVMREWLLASPKKESLQLMIKSLDTL